MKPTILVATLLTAIVLSLVFLLSTPASAQVTTPERVLRSFAADVGVDLVPCLHEVARSPEERVLLCGAYDFTFDAFRRDALEMLDRLVATGAWSEDDGTFVRSFRNPRAQQPGIFHVGFRNGAVLLAYDRIGD